MNITKLYLQNYRNHLNYEVAFKSNLNVIFGNNGCGKTNIVESIYFISYLKSYRTNHEREMINFNFDFAKINLEASDNFEVIINKNFKVCKYNNVLKSKQSEFIGLFKSVLFSPETMELLLKSPIDRRKYLDLILCVIDPLYLNILKEFNYVLKQRNDYLKQLLINSLANKTYFDVLNENYIKLSLQIYLARIDLIKELNKYASEIFKHFFEFDFKIIYDMNNLDINNLEESFKEKLLQRYDKELQLGNTIVGPHRDDLIFEIDNHNAKFFASKGQQRIALITLKLAQVELYNELFNDYPVLILDDVLSELDNLRQNTLFNYLKARQIQTIITTTSLSDIKVDFEFNKIKI